MISQKNCYFSYDNPTILEPSIKKQVEAHINKIYEMKQCSEIPEIIKIPCFPVNIHFLNKDFVKDSIYNPKQFRWIPTIENYL